MILRDVLILHTIGMIGMCNVTCRMKSKKTKSLCDVSTQVSDWHSLSNDAIADAIARRISTHRFEFTSDVQIPLVRNYHRREEYTKVGCHV